VTLFFYANAPPPNPPPNPPPPPSPPPVAPAILLPGTSCFGLAHRFFNGTTTPSSALISDAQGGWTAALAGTATAPAGILNTGVWGWVELQWPSLQALGATGFTVAAWVFPFSIRYSNGASTHSPVPTCCIG